MDASPDPAALGTLTLTIVETNSSTSTATWRTMIPSNRRSILAASSVQRSFCLPGESRKLNLRLKLLAGAGGA